MASPELLENFDDCIRNTLASTFSESEGGTLSELEANNVVLMQLSMGSVAVLAYIHPPLGTIDTLAAVMEEQFDSIGASLATAVRDVEGIYAITAGTIDVAGVSYRRIMASPQS